MPPPNDDDETTVTTTVVDATPDPEDGPRTFLDAVAYLSRQITDVDTVARDAVAGLHEQGVAIRALQAEVFGPSKMPPPLASASPSIPPLPPLNRRPLAKRVTLSEGTTDALTRELANLRAEFKAELSQQSRAMGLPKVSGSEDPPSGGARARAYLFSRQGVKDAIAIATLIAAAAASVAAARGAPPAPRPVPLLPQTR